jgi:hypothetical protein
MPLGQWNLEFLNHNAQRSYPLTADATKKDVTESFELPDDFIVGMDIPVSPAMDMETGKFFIRQIGLYASGAQILVSYDTGSGYVDVASASIPLTSEFRNKVFALGGIDPFDDIVGKIVIGKITTMQAQPGGLFNFTINDTRLEPQVIRPMIRGISSFVVSDGLGNTSDRLYGDIELIAGSNMQLSTVVTATEAKIVISALNGEGTITPCVCEGDAATSPCIKSINSVRPTPDGNINLIGDDCLTFEPIENGLKLTDSCCQPCCGCIELETITKDLERFNSERASLTLFINSLAAQVANLNTTVLGSRLGDKRCKDCD